MWHADSRSRALKSIEERQNTGTNNNVGMAE